MRHYINLVESMMLNEHGIINPGSTTKDIIRTFNVFVDLLGMDNANITGDLSKQFLKRYKKLAAATAKRLEAVSDIPLTPMMAWQANNAWHDGEDYYPPGSEKELSELYANQLDTCDKIAAELENLKMDPALMKNEMLTSILKMIKHEGNKPNAKKNAMAMLNALRKAGMDYPELAAIEKSTNAEKSIT